MDFKSLVRYIKHNGCRVRIYENKKKVHGAIGTFHVTNHGPIISLAIKGHIKKKRVEYLLHEYGHFLQWKEGWMAIMDGVCDTYSIWEDWVTGRIELTPLEFTAARNTMLAIEWDAEIRAYELGKLLVVKHFDPTYHLRGANSYVLGIKWGWKNRKDWSSCPKRKKIKPRVLTKKQLFAPLTRQEKKILEKYKG